MKKNISGLDRTIRLIVGVLLLVLGYYTHWIWYIVALVPLITGLTGYCALYSLFKRKPKVERKPEVKIMPAKMAPETASKKAVSKVAKRKVAKKAVKKAVKKVAKKKVVKRKR